jgi:hypothetical protein
MFESINQGEPEVGDYAICHSHMEFFTEVNDFTETNIGELIKIDSQVDKYKYEYDDNIDVIYMVKYENVPRTLDFLVFKEYGGDSLVMYREDIKYWSKNKEELEKVIESEKYNL